jgi:hypothetical protein
LYFLFYRCILCLCQQCKCNILLFKLRPCWE